MKKIVMVLMVVFSGLMLSSCGGTTTTSQEKLVNNIVTKSGTVTMKSGDEWLLKTDSGIVNMTSTKINLDTYLKQKVKVTGMFSGSTLYVDKVE